MEKILSKRAKIASEWEDFLDKYLSLCLSDPYDETDNPAGYVNLGTAVNNLCNDIIHPRLSSDKVWICDTNSLQYRDNHGTPRLRKSCARFLDFVLEPHEPISPDDIICLTGVTGCLDLLAHCLGDPGDVFLVPTPTYGRIKTDFKQRSLVDIWPIHIITENNTEDYPILTMKKVISAYQDAIANNKVVRGILLINPNNPLGDIYNSELLWDILNFCHQHDLHIIADELYAVSLISKTQKFHSVLKFSKLPNPEKTHVLYGLSKDFGIAGVRLGIIHTKCEPLKRCLWQLSNFPSVPFPVMEITARFIDDLDWCRNYVQIYHQRLSEKFDYCINYMRKIGVKVRDSPAGLFLWIDLHDLFQTFDQEMEFFKYLIEKEKLYIVPGQEFFCAQPGWFRVVFTGNADHLTEGFDRFSQALKKYKSLRN